MATLLEVSKKVGVCIDSGSCRAPRNQGCIARKRGSNTPGPEGNEQAVYQISLEDRSAGDQAKSGVFKSK